MKMEEFSITKITNIVTCPYCGYEGNEVVDETYDWIDGKVWLDVQCDKCHKVYEEEYDMLLTSVNKKEEKSDD